MNDVCTNGKCIPGRLQICFDNNPCTDDTCSPSGGCIFFPNENLCSDGDLCTRNDRCRDGVCVPGIPQVCADDGNPCTEELCDTQTGECHSKNLNVPCEDGDPCTVGDKCDAGICVTGYPKNCDDRNDCTMDACDRKTGECFHVDSSGPCDDGDLCTVNDMCKNGVCTPGEILWYVFQRIGFADPVSDDKDPCTDDYCAKDSGLCKHVFNSAACDDGNACTVGDFCAGGRCLAGLSKNW